MSSHKITVTVTVNDEDVEAAVEFDFAQGRPGRMYMPNGNPGYPDEPSELEVTSIKIDGVEQDQLPADALDTIQDACWDHMSA